MFDEREITPYLHKGDHSTNPSSFFAEPTCLRPHPRYTKRSHHEDDHSTRLRLLSDHITKMITPLWHPLSSASSSRPSACAHCTSSSTATAQWAWRNTIHFPGYLWPLLSTCMHLPALLRNEEIDPHVDISGAVVQPVLIQETTLWRRAKLIADHDLVEIQGKLNHLAMHHFRIHATHTKLPHQLSRDKPHWLVR